MLLILPLRRPPHHREADRVFRGSPGFSLLVVFNAPLFPFFAYFSPSPPLDLGSVDDGGPILFPLLLGHCCYPHLLCSDLHLRQLGSWRLLGLFAPPFGSDTKRFPPRFRHENLPIGSRFPLVVAWELDPSLSLSSSVFFFRSLTDPLQGTAAPPMRHKGHHVYRIGSCPPYFSD